uniref:Putative ubiquitin-like-specific protease 2A isoform X1 n=1 Tax=Rhizophora mucronata TaxID=61149 RepID=A0A2P2M096_RHIMU
MLTIAVSTTPHHSDSKSTISPTGHSALNVPFSPFTVEPSTLMQQREKVRRDSVQYKSPNNMKSGKTMTALFTKSISCPTEPLPAICSSNETGKKKRKDS